MHHLTTTSTIQAGLLQQERLQAAARHRAGAGLSARRPGAFALSFKRRKR